MKYLRYTLLLLAFAAILASCSKTETPEKEKEKEEEEEIEEPIFPRKEGKMVLGYCTYYGSRVPDATTVTHINYAFAELYVRNGEYQKFELQGDESRFREVLKVREQGTNKVKIMLSFSHTVANDDNFQAGGFSVMSSTEKGRKKFAEDCRTFCEKWNIDGIDIDWEFPGISWSGHACDTEHDVANHVLLMKQLRETLGKDYLLSYAGYVMNMKDDASGKRFIDIKAVDPYVDFVNIMTYDIASGKEGQHQSAWNRPDFYYDCKRAVETYLNAGIDPNKLLLGIPFYARHSWSTYTDASGKKCKSAVDFKNFSREYPASEGFALDVWDASGEVPFITKNGAIWAGYDNPKSIRLKGAKISALGLRGMMYWDYDADDSNGTLRKAVWNSVMADY